MAPVGGLRVRLVFSSLYNMLDTALTDLGWFDPGREHLPITFLGEPVDDELEVPLNTLVLTGEQIFTSDIEMGSPRADFTRQFYLDFYAESNALGEHLIYDVKDILQGRMPSIGRTGPIFTAYDYTITPTAPVIGYGEIDGVFVDRAPKGSNAWKNNWWSASFTVTDTYSDESG